MLDVTIQIPGQAISANSLYKRARNGGVFVAPEAIQYRKEAKTHVQRAMRRSPPYQGGLLHAEIAVFQKYFNEDGSIKVVDLDNSLKNLLDSIFPVLGVNDSAVFNITLRKVHTRLKPKCTIRIWETPRPALAGRSLKEVTASMRPFSSSIPEPTFSGWRSEHSTQMASVSLFQAAPAGRFWNRT